MFAAVDGDPGHPQGLPQCQGSGAFCQNAITSHSAPHWIWSCPTSFDSGDSHEQAALKALLSTLELDGVLIQAVGEAFSEGVALHTSPAFFSSPPSRAPTCS